MKFGEERGNPSSSLDASLACDTRTEGSAFTIDFSRVVGIVLIWWTSPVTSSPMTSTGVKARDKEILITVLRNS